jgi:parallel beta-helix repeat protein
MKKRIISVCTMISLAVSLFTSCSSNNGNSNNGYLNNLSFKPGDEAKIVEALLSLKDSTVVQLHAGTYKFDNLSIAQLKHIRFRGEGSDKTILDFSSQTQGGEGIRVTDVTGFHIENIKLQNAKGDLIKVIQSRDVVFNDVSAIWEKSDSSNGGYAIYPVMCKNVLIENCYVQGSSDAGIYVGQTDTAVIRNCKAYMNVAGCEIENTTHAMVYDNEFWGNCAGFLIFDLPTLSKRGGYVKAYNNNIHDNNERNFAKSGSFGTTWGVGNAAPGSGIIVLAASDIEIHNNKIINNNSGSILLASGLATDDSAVSKINENYFPISKNISIHDNTMQMGDSFPQPAYEHRMGKLLIGIEQTLNAKDPSRKNKRIPFILYDGISTNILTNGTSQNPDSLCIRQTGENVFVNADMLHITDSKNWKPGTDMAAFDCK